MVRIAFAGCSEPAPAYGELVSIRGEPVSVSLSPFVVSLSPFVVSLSNHGQLKPNILILNKFHSPSTGSGRTANGERRTANDKRWAPQS